MSTGRGSRPMPMHMVLLIGFVVSFAACGDPLSPVAGITWRLASIVTTDSTIDATNLSSPATLEFRAGNADTTDGTVGGFGGCNSYGGGYNVVGGNRVLVIELSRTTRGCAMVGGGPAPGQLVEEEFLPRLLGLLTYVMEQGDLTVVNSAGDTLRFTAPGS